MYLQKLKIKNFRRIEELEIFFSQGVNIIVGENNVGKTTVVDAIRILLTHVSEDHRLRLTEDDFTTLSEDRMPIEISAVFCDLKDESEEAKLYESLVFVDERFESHLHVRVEFNEQSGRTRIKRWCGETEGNSLPSDLFDHIACIYLPPLRDPQKGLQPGRHSQIARLVRFFVGGDESKKEEFTALAQTANDEMLRLDPIGQAGSTINTEVKGITGEQLAQTTQLGFVDPDFNRLIGALRPLVNGLSVEQNGLGYNNLLYTATTLGTLQRDDELAYRGMLIEEPEAHLHPQLQTLLLKHLNSSTSAKTAEQRVNESEEEQLNANTVQVIMSSHSPTFASQANINDIISMYTDGTSIHATTIGNIDVAPEKKRKLVRYLDATKSELFFAKKILMVEGLSEAILIPAIAQKLNLPVDLNEEAVTVVNVDGLNFDTFTGLFQEGGMKIPVSVLTDGDPAKNCYPSKECTPDISSNTQVLIDQQTDRLKVFHSRKTFEYDLALEPENLPLLVEAFQKMHPTLGAKLETTLLAIPGSREKAERFFTFLFEERNTSKPNFAQELADLLADGKFQCPEYIEQALRYLQNGVKND